LKTLNRTFKIFATIVTIAIIVVSLFIALNWFSANQILPREYYVGVEYAYGNQISEVKALVDKVKDYTNLFILGSVELSFNRTALTEASDYIIAAKLNLIVFFTSSTQYDYAVSDRFNYTVFDWMADAKQKYGSQFLGIYRYDEPGGHQIDVGPSQIINNTVVPPNVTYSQISESYVGNLSIFPYYYLNYAPKIFTSDYALYWFDYKANYTTIFAEFVGNESRQRHIALCRGAADAFNKDWGVIVTWKYNQAPYLESGDELYSDLALAYSAGAKYTIVFSYPNITNYGTLTEKHFDALQRFWNTLHSDPQSLGSNTPQVAYVVPRDYGFGFRSANDSIWGFFYYDLYSAKIYNDVETLTARYGAHLNIFYDEPQTMTQLQNYQTVYYWNQTIS
jgi:hypothetical protein